LAPTGNTRDGAGPVVRAVERLEHRAARRSQAKQAKRAQRSRVHTGHQNDPIGTADSTERVPRAWRGNVAQPMTAATTRHPPAASETLPTVRKRPAAAASSR